MVAAQGPQGSRGSIAVGAGVGAAGLYASAGGRLPVAGGVISNSGSGSGVGVRGSGGSRSGSIAVGVDGHRAVLSSSGAGVVLPAGQKLSRSSVNGYSTAAAAVGIGGGVGIGVGGGASGCGVSSSQLVGSTTSTARGRLSISSPSGASAGASAAIQGGVATANEFLLIGGAGGAGVGQGSSAVGSGAGSGAPGAGGVAGAGIPKRQGSFSNVFSKLIDGMPAGTMFSKFKSANTASTSLQNITDANPISQYFEIGKQVACAGPELVWRIHDGYRKSDGRVSSKL